VSILSACVPGPPEAPANVPGAAPRPSGAARAGVPVEPHEINTPRTLFLHELGDILYVERKAPRC
jgi:hypothetical protein